MAQASPLPLLIGLILRWTGRRACLLYGYGAYEACLDAGVRPRPAVGAGPRRRLRGRARARRRRVRPALVAAGQAAGEAEDVQRLHRGGGLAGGRRAGRACRWSTGSRIVSRGLSAGGLLQGAVYSRAPGRWRAVVAEVPFVDCVTTMLDPAIPLTINEWDEWGDPRDPADFACLRSYSPYDNPPAGATAGPAGHRRCARPAGARARAGQVGGAAAGDRHRRQPAAVPGRAGRGRAHRAVGPVRSPALRGRGAGVHPRRLGRRPGSSRRAAIAIRQPSQ